MKKIPELREKMIAHVNRKDWWHVPPVDPKAYHKRGKFYASSFREAEFWGRPIDEPFKVNVKNPLIGDEESIQKALFGRLIPEPAPNSGKVLEWRWTLDAKMKREALAKGYDAIVLLGPTSYTAFIRSGKIPRSIELNVLKP